MYLFPYFVYASFLNSQDSKFTCTTTYIYVKGGKPTIKMNSREKCLLLFTKWGRHCNNVIRSCDGVGGV